MSAIFFFITFFFMCESRGFSSNRSILQVCR